MIDSIDDQNMRIVIHEDKRPANQHARRYNPPTGNEVGILMPNEPCMNRDIVLQQREGGLKHVSELHRAYDTLQYPILFMHGTDGYSIYLKTDAGRKITQMQYYGFHIMYRPTNYLLYCCKLFQQYLVDAFCKMETERLQYLRREQKSLRADNYQNFRDSILNDDSDPRTVGQRIILPSSYTGGPRYMHERQQDSIAYVRAYGRPNLFITTTTNPKWKEILDNLLPNQSPNDRPDIVVRVFHLKLKKLMDMLKNGFFGKAQAWLYAVEFQKRGLPHAHILVWLEPGSKIRPDDIDCIISAEIPCPTAEPILHNLVKSHMIHGPCGILKPNSPCMKDGYCTKNFPRDLQDTTTVGNDCYPKYRRLSPEDGGNVIRMTKIINDEIIEMELDNKWVVPYNKHLLRQMNCHTNVEICSSIKSIKYVLKYVHKGSDQAIFSLQTTNKNDEITLYEEARYVGSMEAAMRIMGFPIHERFPPVFQLCVHLENGQRVYFTETNAREIAARNAPQTMLTAFFTLNKVDEFACKLLYVEIPQFYTWDAPSKKWNRRKQGAPSETDPGIFKSPCLGRVYTISPKQSECYYMRLLLHEVRGPKSFNDLKTLDGEEFNTFRQMCLALHLIDNDDHFHRALEEAAVAQSGHHLRKLFTVILTACDPSDPLTIWQRHKMNLAEDIFHKAGVSSDDDGTQTDRVYNECLNLIEQDLLRISGKTVDHYGLPAVQVVDFEQVMTREYRFYTDYNVTEQVASAAEKEMRLTDEQKMVAESFLNQVENKEPGVSFLDAPGGTGKTFLLNYLLAKLRSNGCIVIACASSGIAATLIPGGKTLHSTFKIPLDVHNRDHPTCCISKNSALATILKEARGHIVDEALMTHKKAYEAMDYTMRDVTGINQPFGGIPTLLCGDKRQIPPVVKNGTRSNTIDATIQKSYLWPQVKMFNLTQNMRVHLANDFNDNTRFSDFLLSIGEGRYTIHGPPDIIKLPPFINQCESTDALIEAVYGEITTRAFDHTWFLGRSILAPLNDTVNSINYSVLNKFPGEQKTYKSIDSTLTTEEAVHFPVEFLNSIDLSALPPHLLFLKVGSPIIVLRSLDPPNITNGTRCIVHQLHPNVIEVVMLNGPGAGKRALIPRIPLIPSDSDLPFTFKRLQFPIRLAYAMTFNKSQGQTFKCVGLDLNTPVFSHGMLYVALSRVGSPDHLHVHAPDHQTRNVVYNELLQ